MIPKDEYGDYYSGYIALCNNIPLVELLTVNAITMDEICTKLNDKDSLYRYNEGKWSVKEVIGHITDTERIFGYRALSIARGEAQPLPGYDHNSYVRTARFNIQPLRQLVEQYHAVRQSTIVLFSSFTEGDLMKKGEINSHLFSVRAMGYVIAGHELHHTNILRDKYLPSVTKK